MNQLSPATSVRYHVLMIVCVLAVLAYINRLGFSSSQPLVSRDLDFDTEDVGWLSAMFLMAYALFEMPWGMLADRWGARHLLPALVVGWSLVTACAALAAEMVGYLSWPSCSCSCASIFRHVSGRGLSGHLAHHGRLDSTPGTRFRAGVHLDVDAAGSDRAALADVRADCQVRQLASAVLDPGLSGTGVGGHLLVLVPQST